MKELSRENLQEQNKARNEIEALRPQLQALKAKQSHLENLLDTKVSECCRKFSILQDKRRLRQILWKYESLQSSALSILNSISKRNDEISGQQIEEQKFLYYWERKIIYLRGTLKNILIQKLEQTDGVFLRCAAAATDNASIHVQSFLRNSSRFSSIKIIAVYKISNPIISKAFMVATREETKQGRKTVKGLFLKSSVPSNLSTEAHIRSLCSVVENGIVTEKPRFSRQSIETLNDTELNNPKSLILCRVRTGNTSEQDDSKSIESSFDAEKNEYSVFNSSQILPEFIILYRFGLTNSYVTQSNSLDEYNQFKNEMKALRTKPDVSRESKKLLGKSEEKLIGRKPDSIHLPYLKA